MPGDTEDALVEAVARALCDKLQPEPCGPEEPPCHVCTAEARAAIAAARPAIEAAAYQRAAEVADGFHERAVEWAKRVRGLERYIDETDSSRIAAAIRALAEVPK